MQLIQLNNKTPVVNGGEVPSAHVFLNCKLMMLMVSTEATYCTAVCWTVSHSKSGRVLRCAAQLSLWQGCLPLDLRCVST